VIHHFCHFPSIDFCHTFHEHMSRWWLTTRGFIFRKVSIKGSNFPKTVFLGYFRVPCLCSAYGSRLHSFHPLMDNPQIYPSWVTFAEGCTIFQLSTSESLPLPQYQQWQNRPIIFTARRYAERGICYGNSVRPSVCPSVRHTGGSVKNG